MIVVQADPSDPDDVARARQKIEKIHEYLEKGANFEQLAKNESEALSASDGGDMGWSGKGVLPERLEDIAFRLEPGQYSDIIEDHRTEDLVYRIIYVEERRNF
jgi:parvulin-like peptidyl-prolyl isomerase